MDENLINQEKEIIDFLYIFNEGRQKRINELGAPQDFFYFYNKLKQKTASTTFIELQELDTKYIYMRIIKTIEKVFIKYLKIPLYGHKLLSTQNFLLMKRSKHLILTNETIGYSMLFIIKYLKRKNPGLQVTMFVMGLFQESNLRARTKRLILKSMLKEYDKFIFLGKPEYEYACQYKFSFRTKFHYLTFAIDSDFWNTRNSLQIKDTILFVGNDMNRDYELLGKIAKELCDYKFTIISNRFKTKNFSSNVQLINSDWRSGFLTDTQLKSIYETAKISLIPTKDTLQPSGQSVGLQSISMKIPLIVSESKGFWGKGALEHSKDIFVLKNDLNIWKEVIIKLMEDKSLQKDITENAYIKFQKYFNYEHTFKKFIKIIA
jgi:glycosyltransferase involved in cell wall biosynthesis